MKILHLEDSEALRFAVTRSLQSTDYDLVSVSTVEQALAELDTIDLMITDWNLVGETSQLAIEEAKRLGIPILLFSGMPPKDIDVHRIVSKGGSTDELLEVIKELI